MPPLIIASTNPRMGKTSLVASIAYILGSDSSDIKIGVLPSNENAQKDIENIKKLLSRKKRCQITQDFFLGLKNKKKSSSDILKFKSIIEGSDDVKSNMSLAEDLDGRILLIVNFADDIINIAKIYKDGKRRDLTKEEQAQETFKKITAKKRGIILRETSKIFDLIVNNLNNNDYLMIKGSNSTGLHSLVDSLKKGNMYAL